MRGGARMTEALRKAREQAHYDRRAGHVDDSAYDWTSGADRMSPALRAPYRHLETLLADCAGLRVLDYGCGHGIFSIVPAKLGAQVVGVDISPRSLAFARQRAVREQVSARAHFSVGDCERLPFPDRTFDIVMSCGVLSCLNLRRGVAEVARVLRPDGRAIFVDTLGHNPVMNARRTWAKWRGRRTDWTTQHILTVPDLQVFERQFRQCSVRPFDLSTLLLAGCSLKSHRLIEVAAAADRWMLQHAAISRLAFKVVVDVSGPRP
jgi:ubiquinone/menaquinone biosynthesis C-methylase UbiE